MKQNLAEPQWWPVVKEKDVKQGQEFKYLLCWNWMIKAKSLKALLAIKEYVLG